MQHIIPFNLQVLTVQSVFDIQQVLHIYGRHEKAPAASINRENVWLTHGPYGQHP